VNFHTLEDFHAEYPLTLPSPRWGEGRVRGPHVKGINAFVLG